MIKRFASRAAAIATGGLWLSFIPGCGYGPEARFAEPVASTPAVEALLNAACLPETRAAHTKPEDIISESGERSVEVVHEERENIDAFYAVGADCIDRPLKDVWATLHNSAALQWDETSLEKLEKREHGAQDVFAFQSFQKADQWPHPSWYIDWVHRLHAGSLASPERVQVIFQKTKGTRFIQHWAGQIILQQKDNRTAAYMSIELKGSRISTQNCKGAITSQIERLKTQGPNFTYFP